MFVCRYKSCFINLLNVNTKCKRFPSIRHFSFEPYDINRLTHEKLISDEVLDSNLCYEDDEYNYPLSNEDLKFNKLRNNNFNDSFLKFNCDKTTCVDEKQDLDENCALDKLIKSKYDENTLNERNELIVQYLELLLRERVNNKCSVSLFGSAINGLWTDTSDLDVCVQIPNVHSRSAIIRNLRRISTVLIPISSNRTFEYRFTAKIPILHWKLNKKVVINNVSNKIIYSKNNYEIFENLEMPSIDISINNVLAVVNSSLISAYVSCDDRVRKLILCLKLWAKNRDLNDRSKGTLGSFAITLMVIHFLQRCTPPILPSLQDLAFSINESPRYVSGVDCRFTNDPEKIENELIYLRNDSEPNNKPLRILLMEFFKYFGWFNIHSPNKPICIRSIDCYNFEHINEYQTPFHVDNPFEIGTDVANIASQNQTRIINEMRKTYHLLLTNNNISNIL